jgi:ribose transport system permease protein
MSRDGSGSTTGPLATPATSAAATPAVDAGAAPPPERAGWRPSRSAGAATGVVVATVLLFAISKIVEPQSLSHSSLLGMLPFAAILAIVAVGQTLVIQQGGIDLSVPGMISLTVVLMTSVPDGDDGKLATAIVYAVVAAVAAGLLSGVLVSRVGITPIVTTLGMNALLYGFVIQVSNGNPPPTTRRLNDFATSKVAGVPTTVVIAIVVTALVAWTVKKTVAGRRFEGVGASNSGARAAGLVVARHKTVAYVAAALLYCLGGILLGGVVSDPSAFQGDAYLLPSVAAVVLGGTSLLGGRGSVAASAVAAVFVTQLDQLLLTSGATSAVQNLVQAGALAVGIAIYSVPWARVRGWRRERSEPGAAVTVNAANEGTRDASEFDASARVGEGRVGVHRVEEQQDHADNE